jgi:uncharacterized membrane protein YidH (DUF202 family)
MDEKKTSDQTTATLSAMHALLTQLIEIRTDDHHLHESMLDLDKQRTRDITDLLDHTEFTNGLANERTNMAKERTDLVRKQTQLSTRSTELSVIRTDMSRERSGLAEQRTDMAVLRTDLSRSRTGLAEQRTQMATNRTKFSLKRTTLAGSRTILSNIRTSLAQGRTYLALIRTGLAFFSIAIAFFRMFGISWWTLFDGLLAVGSLAMTAAGLTGYLRATSKVKTLQKAFAAEQDAAA